jgi:hypothetical protein
MFDRNTGHFELFLWWRSDTIKMIVLNWTRIILVSVFTRTRPPRLRPILGLDLVLSPPHFGLGLDLDSIFSGIGLDSVSL